jgi:hypothetical protein
MHNITELFTIQNGVRGIHFHFILEHHGELFQAVLYISESGFAIIKTIGDGIVSTRMLTMGKLQFAESKKYDVQLMHDLALWYVGALFAE